MNRVKVPVPSHRLLIVGWWVAGFAILGLIGYLLATVIQLSGRSETSQADRADIRQEVAVLESDLLTTQTEASLLAEQLESLGQVPVIEPAESTTIINQNSPRPLIDALIRLSLSSQCGVTCKGETGPPGASVTGPPGSDGAAGKNGQDGAPGAPGANGVDGVPGRGITSVSCESDGTWLFAFTDGTTQSVSGPCRVTEPTDPEPPVVLEPAA